MSDHLARLNEVFQEVFEDDGLKVTRETTSKDVKNWDSLMHVTLMLNIEKAFGVRFKSSEVAGFSNVGQLIELIEARAGRG